MNITHYRFRMLSIVILIAAICAPLFGLNRPAMAQATMPDQMMMSGLGLKLDIMSLEDLGEGWAYEGWLIVDDAPVSTGVFTVDADGNLSTDTFAVSRYDHANATAFVLTIEPALDDNPAPSNVHLLGGDFTDGTTDLSIGHPAAIGTDFTDATGSYIIGLGYPEGATAANDYTNGIWYPNSLELPALPDGWVYEGWIANDEGPISTGRFSAPNAIDQDGSGPTAGGPDTGPNFPGQDFLDPPLNIIGYAAVISVEPEPDNSDAPFTLKPLVDSEIEDVGDHGSQEMMNNAVGSSPTGTATLIEEMSLAVNGLEDLGVGWAYEGWLIVDGAPISTGLFTIDADGHPSADNFMVRSSDRANATAFVLTIEPSPDDDPAPSAAHVLGGDFSSGTASLDVAHPAALGADFSSISGRYVLSAPSGGADQPYVNGIWWLDPDAGPGPSLDLPELPSGWVYEGWVANDDGPISTGRFTTASGFDSDDAGPTAGPEAIPPFPGQDFVDPAIDLTNGYAAVISIEPEPDNSPAPFAYKPLIDPEIEDVGGGVLQEMEVHLETLATGTASFLTELKVDIAGLENLGDGWVYEGWLIVDDSPVSTGLFTIDAEGMLSTDIFMVNALDARDAAAFVLTIEPSPDNDPAPSAVHVLGGDFSNGMADLSVAHPAALDADFSGISGRYVLSAPSGGADQPYVNGIWWLDPDAGPGPSLDLPELPSGWVYEGWVANDDEAITTGRFTTASGFDSDDAGPTAGPEAIPPFPGQDFVDPAIDLTSGYAAVISIEPEPDNSPAPFAYKPLIDPEIEDVGGGILQEMEVHLETLATGTVVHMVSELPDTEMAEAMPETAGEDEMTIAAQGEFMPVHDDYHGEGIATIYREGDSHILRLTEFQVTNGPQLHVLLIENAAAVSNSELGAYVDLGPLKGNTGDQNYEIPDDVDLSQYSGVMIYCMPFHAAFTTAVLVSGQ